LKGLQALPGDHEFLPYFIGDGKEHVFHVNASELTSSLLPSNREFLKNYNYVEELLETVKEINCQTKTLDDAIGDRPVDYLKIDVQGATKMVIDHAPKVLARCPMLVCEVEFNPLYKDQPLFGDVDSVMRDHDYMLYQIQGKERLAIKPLELTRREDFARYGQDAWADFVYVPDHDRLATIEFEDGLRLALFATLLHGFNDYTLHVLDRLDHREGTDYLSKFAFAFRDKSPIKFTVDGKAGEIPLK
jgi:hypothetical protein